MKQRFSYDGVVKDLFQKDDPSLLEQLTGGVKVGEFLNLELAVVEERVADLLVLLADDTILHLDFQSHNHRDMAYRQGIYGLMAGQKYRRRLHQVVLYMGEKPMRMVDRLDMGGIQVSYRLMDIRELDADTLLSGGHPGDYALALLARGGTARLREIIEQANRLSGEQRQRVLTQLVLLSGLHGASERLTMEFRAMGMSVEIEKNVFLKNIHEAARAQGKAEGKAEGMAAILRGQLESKFGALPKWAEKRLANATPVQAERWARKVLTGKTLEGVVGKQ